LQKNEKYCIIFKLKKGEMIMANKIKYTEPAGYFPESIRKKHKIGEYAEEKTDAKTDTKKTPAKKADTKKK
jgi:hypothetical protein